MSVKEMMLYGCDRMTAKEKETEQARRLELIVKINKLGEKIASADEQQKAKLLKKLQRIKRAEIVWLRPAAWFLYD